MFLEFVFADVEALELRQLDGGQFSVLVCGDLENAELWEEVFVGEDVDVLDLVLGEVERDQLVQVLNQVDVDDVVSGQV